VKRSPLKRKTPLKGGSQLKRSPLRKVSNSKNAKAKRNKYKESKKEYMSGRKNPHHCEACEGLIGIDNLDLHHKAGRAGSTINLEGELELNLTNKINFMSACRTCHNWIHANPKQARERNWLI